MITRAALQHESRLPYACPLDSTHLRVFVKVGAGEVRAAAVRFGDRYARHAGDRQLPMQRDGTDGLHDYWAATLPIPTRRVRYAFHLKGEGESLWWGPDGFGRRSGAVEPFQYPYLTTADLFRQPDWLAGMTVYQIFPDRFHNGDPGNDPQGPRLRWDGRPRGGAEMAGGDLEGIRQKLGYLADLGVGVFYMTPIFAAGSNHKYDADDYYQIDPSFGTNALFRQLVREAHAAGLRVLLDGVFNHCGVGFFAFQDLREKGPDSPYASWFHRIDSFPVDPAAANYETFATGLGSMPKLNTADPGCSEYFLDVGEHWIEEAGIDGWRLDVANEVDHAFWRRFRVRVKARKPEAWILGEIWHPAADWQMGDQFDSIMHYPWRDAVLAFLQGKTDAQEFDRALCRLRHLYGPPYNAGLLHLLDTHDTPRVRTVLGGPELARLAAMLLFTAPGVPLVYYGDEIGMEGGPDPDCRRPMVWDTTRQDHETLDLYRRLIRLRRDSPGLSDGGWETLRAAAGERVYFYRRTGLGRQDRGTEASDALYVLLNAGEDRVTLRIAVPEGGRWRDIFAARQAESPARNRPSKGRQVQVTLAPRAGRLFLWEANR